MAKIRELEISELREIYHSYMRDDFPLMELRPWFSIERAWNRDGYAAYGYFEEERLIAYASFYSCSESPYLLLDYFAVVPDLRGRGIGSSFLRDLLTEVPAKGGIFGEAESVSSAKNEKEESIRKRRLTFYQKNGAVLTGVNCLLFGVDYDILYFPGNGTCLSDDDFFDEVCRLYRELYRPLYGRLCKPYREE